MPRDQNENVLDRQHAIVSRYASELRAAACGRQPVGVAPIHCYTLVNQCALELFEASRRHLGGDADPDGVTAAH